MKGVIIVYALTPEYARKLKKGDVVLLFDAKGKMKEAFSYWKRRSPKIIFLDAQSYTRSYETDLSDLPEGFTLRKALISEQLKLFNASRESVLNLKQGALGKAILGLV